MSFIHLSVDLSGYTAPPAVTTAQPSIVKHRELLYNKIIRLSNIFLIF